MSWRATAIVQELSEGLTCREKLVLLLLSNRHHDDTGQCNPSIARLAREGIMSERQVQRCIRSLAHKRFITVLDARGGRSRSNNYHLDCVDASLKGDTMTPFTPGKGDRVTPFKDDGEQKGDIPAPERVTNRAVKGDTAMSPEPYRTRDGTLDPSPPSSQTTSSKTSERGAPNRSKHQPIDADFLTDMCRDFPAVDVDRERLKFDDWRRSKDRRFKDERAAFRNWLRKAEEFLAARGPPRSTARVTDLKRWVGESRQGT